MTKRISVTIFVWCLGQRCYLVGRYGLNPFTDLQSLQGVCIQKNPKTGNLVLARCF